MFYSFGTDIGKVREKNEDSAVIIKNNLNDVFMLVLDGMGGHKQGDIASLKAQDFFVKSFQEQKKFSGSLSMKMWLKSKIRQANKMLNDYSNINPSTKGMGATMSCFLLHNDKLILAYIGDTRAYIIKDGGIKQISEDETYVQFLYDSGRIRKEEMLTHPSRHVVTNAIGCYKTAIINVKEVKEDYDYLLLCSDGLYNMVDEHKICSIIERNGENVDNSVSELIAAANDNGGIDNIALCILKRGE